MHSHQQLDSFNQRIKRISDPKNTFYVDAETGMKIPKRISKDIIARNGKGATPSIMALLLAMALGIFCLMGARLLRYTMLDIPESSDATLLVELALAAIIAFVLGGIMGQKTLRHMFAHVAGAAFMAVTMHNLVWMFPAEFAAYYSQDYVNDVQSNTSPLSLYLRGETYTI